MRRIVFIALANIAVVGLVLVAAIGNIASACTTSAGCGGAPPLAWFGIGLALLAALGVFVAMRRWARETRGDESVKVGSFARGKAVETDPPTITTDAEIELRSRNRLGRIASTVQAESADGEDAMEADDAAPFVDHGADAVVAMADDELAAIPESEPLVSDDQDEPAGMEVDNFAASTGDPADGDGGAFGAPALDPAESADEGFELDVFGAAPIDSPAGTPAWAPSAHNAWGGDASDDDDDDDLPFITPWRRNAAADAIADTDGAPMAEPIPHASDDVPAHAPEGGRDRAVASGTEEQAEAETPSSTYAAPDGFSFTTPPFAELAPSGFPATMRELGMLVDALRGSVPLDEEGAADVAAWSAVIAPFASEVPVSEDDRAAFATWVDALIARTGADLALPIETVLYAARMPRLDGRATGGRSDHSAAA